LTRIAGAADELDQAAGFRRDPGRFFGELRRQLENEYALFPKRQPGQHIVPRDVAPADWQVQIAEA
jgi:hypothetical protein